MEPTHLARLPAGERVMILALLQAARAVRAQVEALTAEIAQQVADVPEVRRLLTLTGVLGAATIWAKLGNPHRFPGPKQVARYAGLDPPVERDRRGRITRHRGRLLRWMLNPPGHDQELAGQSHQGPLRPQLADFAAVELPQRTRVMACRRPGSF